MRMDAGSAEDFVGEEGPRTFWSALGTGVLAVGSLLVGAMLTVVIPILPNIAQEMAHGGGIGLSTQILIAMPMLGLVIGGVLSTMIFSHVRARTVFLGALVIYGVIGALGAVANVPVLIGLRLLMGIVSACIGAASTALVGERVAPERRPRVLGWAMAAASLVSILAMIISGRVADLAGWRSSFLVFPALALILFLIAATCTRPTAVRVRQSSTHPVSNWSAIVALWPIFLFVVAVNLTAFTTNSQASFVLAEGGITSSTGRAQVMALNQIMIVIAALAFPVIRAGVGARFMPALILVIMGSGLTLLGLSSSMTNAAIALGVLGVGNGLLFPFQSSLLLQRASGAVRGQAAGLMVSSQFLADAINPIVLGPFVLSFGLRNTITMVGVMALLGFLGALIFGARSSAAPAQEVLSHG